MHIAREKQAEFLKNIRKKSNLSQRKFAEKLGKSGAYIAQVEKGASALSKEVYDSIIEKYSHLAVDNNNDCVAINILGNVNASCGYGVTVYSEEKTGTYEISKKLADDLGIDINSADMIFASGDSMLPTIEGGDSLLVDRTRKEIYDGKIYCVRIEGQVYAKRLQKLPPWKIKIISDNDKKYDSIYVDFSKKIDFDFEVIGEIRWWGRVSR